MLETASLNWSPQIWIKETDKRIAQFSPRALMYPVAEWVDKRPAMQLVNSEIEFMVLRILEEILEIEEGLGVGGLELAKELNDLLFFLISLAHNLGQLEEIHLPTLANRLNGFGSHDNALDKMREVAGNMGNKQNVMKDINWMLSAWMSYWKHGPVEMDPVVIMKKVLEKNGTHFTGNHPDMYYTGRDSQTGEKLNPDEMYAQYIHVRAMLRSIRMALGNVTTGLKASDHLKYKSLIQDFRRSKEALEELMRYLTLTPRISEHLRGYHQNAEENVATSYHVYSRVHAQSPEEAKILIPQPGLRGSSRKYH